MNGQNELEFWNCSGTLPGQAADTARRSESAGFDGHSFGDTQCISTDPFVNMTVAAGATTRLKVSTRVTNPLTRHPANTACAIASVQIASGGRAVIGVGRGDSAVAQLGMRAGTVAELERFVARLQTYLRGEAVDIDGHPSSLHWLPDLDLPKVPVEVAATGPAVIAVGARVADQIGFNVGADLERLRNGITLARKVRAEAGLDPDSLSFGAFVNVAPHPDIDVARDLAKGALATYARFSAMTGRAVDGLNASDASIVTNLANNYDRSRHARSDAPHTALLPTEFIDRFGVVGSPELCAERLADVIALGIHRLMIVGAGRYAPAEQGNESRRLLAEEVLPRLRAQHAGGGGTSSA